MATVTRSYLTEDLAQILRYFPDACRVTFDTPFDIQLGGTLDDRKKSVCSASEKQAKKWKLLSDEKTKPQRRHTPLRKIDALLGGHL